MFYVLIKMLVLEFLGGKVGVYWVERRNNFNKEIYSIDFINILNI